jgi:hypothetical protein
MGIEAIQAEGVVGTLDHVESGRHPLSLDQYKHLLISQGALPSRTEAARARKLYGANTGAGTAKAPVAAPPTTAAAWALYNGYGDPYHLVVFDLYATSISGTLGLGMSLIAGLPGTKQAAAETAYASSVHEALTPGSPSPQAVFAGAVTLESAPVWTTVAARDQVSAISVGSGLVANVDGMFIVPPGYALGLSVLAPAGTTALFQGGFVYGVFALKLG